MKKFVIPAVLVSIMLLFTSMPALAQPDAAPVPMPANTASPRDWGKLAPEGQLKLNAVTAESAILIDAKTGKVLFEKEPDKQEFPASITKIMTCLVALDSKKDLSDIVTIGQLPVLEAGAETIGLKPGEQITLKDLLYGLMMASGNDAANAIAAYIGDGSVQTFIDMMNAKAQELGMTNTHYMNTNGLDDPEHYTTARDMSTLAMAAVKNPEFEEITQTWNYKMDPTNTQPSPTPWTNHNLLIDPSSKDVYSYKYATGIKTGYTSTAQSTLVSSAQKDNVQLIAVVLHDTKSKIPKWTDSITMLEYGFNFYDTLDVTQLLGSQPFDTTIKNAAAGDPEQGKLDLSLYAQSTGYITDSKDTISKLRNDPSLFLSTVAITKDSAPIKKGDVVGTVTYTYNGATVLVFDLLASRDVDEMPQPSPSQSAVTGASATARATAQPAGLSTSGTKANTGTRGGAGSVMLWLGVLILLALLALVTIRFANMRRRNKKRRRIITSSPMDPPTRSR